MTMTKPSLFVRPLEMCSYCGGPALGLSWGAHHRMKGADQHTAKEEK